MHIAFDLTLPARSQTGTGVYAAELLAALQAVSSHRVTVVGRDRRSTGRPIVDQADRKSVV